MVASLLNRDVTLTNRTVIWEIVLNLGINPIIGSGFASTWLTPHQAMLDNDMDGLCHCHNGYLETYLHTGLIGVLLLLPVLVTAGHNAARRLVAGSIIGPLFMALFLAGVIYNYTEVAFNTNNIIGFGLWLLAAFGIGSEVVSQPVHYQVDQPLEPGVDPLQPELEIAKR